MPKVTKIEVQKKNKERFNLFLDGEFEMGIDIDTLVKFNLKKDQILEPSDMQIFKNMITTVEVLILQFNTCLIRNVLKEKLYSI